jgi:hypothetical protein
MENIFEDSTLTIKADETSFKIFHSGQDIFEMSWEEFYTINMASQGDVFCYIIFGSMYFSDSKKVTQTLYQWGKDNSYFIKKLRG